MYSKASGLDGAQPWRGKTAGGGFPLRVEGFFAKAISARFVLEVGVHGESKINACDLLSQLPRVG